MFRQLPSFALALLLPGVAIGAYPNDSVCTVRSGQLAGTGFVVGANDKELLCVGAAHAVADGDKTVGVTWSNGSRQDGKVLAIDRSIDEVAFSVPNRAGDRLPLVLADTKVENGPFSGIGSTGKITTGSFSAVQPGAFAITGSNAEGDSGGPVLDKNGQAAGQMVGSTTGPNGKTLAVSGQQIRKFVVPFVGGAVPVGDLTADPSFRLTALHGCNARVTVQQNVNNANDVLNQNPRFNFPFLGNRLVNNQNKDEDIAVLENEILALQQNLQVNQYQQPQQPVAAQPGPPGPPGAPGDPGSPGSPGAPGEVDYSKVWQWLRDHKSEFTAAPAAEPVPVTKPTSDTADKSPEVKYFDIRPHTP